jgi:LacI family transcriptional regulator
MVINGVEAYLSQRKYFFITVAHRHKQELLDQYSDILLARGVEGLITIDTSLTVAPALPTVAVAGHRRVKGVTNIVLDHDRAAQVALQHLCELGHRDIALMRGQTFSSDSEDRWRAITRACRDMGIAVRPNLTIHLDKDDPSPQLAHELTRELLSRGEPFSALFAYNDISAIGAIRAIGEVGLRVPQNISVIGFDDIRDAAYHVPALTTIRQPLRRMGELAAEILVDRIENRKEYVEEIAVRPELVVRETTAVPAIEPALANP